MTDNFENKVAVDGPVANEGELGSSSQVSPAGPLGLGQRWTVKREVALRRQPVELLRQLGASMKARRDRCLACRSGEGGTGHRHEADRGVDHAGGTAGGQDGDVRPFGAAEVAAMSAATSPGTGLAYGLQRVCAAWGFARSSFYAMKSRQQATAERPPAKRRTRSDEALLVVTWRHPPGRATARSGLGFGSVVASVSRKRVLRVMRENNLLSPQKSPCR